MFFKGHFKLPGLSSILFAFLLGLPSLVVGLEANRPNILFILTDDQRWDSLGCYGNKAVKTPNLDQLAGQGVRMDGFYVSDPLCCPSRASFLTGLYPNQMGIRVNEAQGLPKGTKTVADYLNEAGYVTGLIGKTHVGNDPFKWGFKHCPVYDIGGQTRHHNPVLFVNRKSQTVSGMTTAIFVDAAIEFVRAHQKENWFLWLAVTVPHSPYIGDPKYDYDAAAITPPPGWPPGSDFPKALFAKYYANMTMLDQQLGRLLSELKQLNLDNKTFVLVASDNGHMFGSHKVVDKQSWYEGSARVPAIARWPGHIKQSGILKNVISNVDVLPTFLELAGISNPKNIDAYSMIPALTTAKPLRTSAFSRSMGWRMVRKGPWKFVRYDKGGKPEQLYNIENDPMELNNLLAKPELKDVISELRGEIDAWLKRTPNAKDPVFTDVPAEKKISEE